MANSGNGSSRGGGRKSSSSSGGSSSGSSKKSGSSSGGSSSGSKKSRSSQRSSNGRKPREIVRDATEQLQELIGRPVEAVLGIEKDGSEWAVAVEVLELERVPSTTDVLGKYEVTVDGDGDVIAARRTRRYLRSQSGED